MRRSYRIAPLVVFTPKSLLRSPLATSQTDDFTTGSFQPVIDDADAQARPERVRRVLLSCGKVHYDLKAGRDHRAKERPGIASAAAMVRVEQLYPWPSAEIARVLQQYDRAEEVYWVQEEPANMGAWTFVRERIQDLLRPNQKLGYAGRSASASPAGGSARLHHHRQNKLVDTAFSGLE